jgi:uncharacterized repeat protein (TIGR03806 family)
MRRWCQAIGCLLLMFGIGAGVPLATALDSRPTVGPFLDGALPQEEANTTGWSAVDAFPGLTFDNPTFIVAIPGTTKLCVGTQQGLIFTIEDDPATAASTKTLILDLSAVTQGAYDSGMMGLAFHPDFGQAGSPNRGFFYVSYSYSPSPVNDVNAPSTTPSYNRLSRFTFPDGAAVADRNSEQVLINQFDRHLWHNGGGMFFGPDGFLYLTMGDEGDNNDPYLNGGRVNRGLFSGVLRIDVDRNPARSHPIRRQPLSGSAPPAGWPKSYTQNYYIPNDNPWLATNGSVLEEYYAIGFRSPHRITYDAATNRIWLGDVGQSSWEEVNLIEKGGNYQWSFREGAHDGGNPRPSTVLGVERPPVFEYPHRDGYTAVIGGYVYRGTEHAAYLDGKYIFGDNGTSRIRAMSYDGSGTPEIVELCTVPNGGSEITGLSTFGLNQSEELLMCTVGVGVKLYKLARSGGGDEPPALLSQTGAFTDLATLTPAAALIPYTVNAPLWSDHAAKRRWMCVPSGQTATFSVDGAWSFPVGTVFVKHFELPVDETNPAARKRLETRFLVHGANGKYYGLTYKWRADQSDADLLAGSVSEVVSVATASGSRDQTWFYPGRQDCLVCHNANANHVLGLRTAQLNGLYTYPNDAEASHQILTLSRIGMFANPPAESEIDNWPRSAAITDTGESPELRVRSYLDSNCAHCHRPNGVRANFDARLETPLALQGLIRGPVNDTLGIFSGKVIVPNDLSRSLLYQRDNRLGTAQMPPLAKNVVDAAYISVLGQWIKSLPPSLAPPAMIGNASEGGGTDTITDGSGSYINATLFPVSSPGTLTEIRAKVGAIAGSYRCAIYADDRGEGGTLLRSSATLTGVAAGWQTFTLESPLSVSTGRSYWLAIWSDDVDARVHFSSGGTLKWGVYPFGSWPTQLGFTGAGGNSYCLYATGPGSVQEPPGAQISASFSWQPPVNSGSRYRVSGLPRGLRMDAATGRISGVPDVSGIFNVAITETFGRTSTTQRFGLSIDPFPSGLVGNHAGLIARDATVNGELGGSIGLSVSRIGGVSGRVFVGATSYPLRGRLALVADELPQFVTSAGPYAVTVLLDPATGVMSGEVSLGGVDATISGRRQGFLSVGSRDSAGVTVNVALRPLAPALGDLTQPQGSGYLRMNYSRRGAISAGGKLADGSRLTLAGIVGNDGRIRLRQLLHGAKGSLQGEVASAQPTYSQRPLQADLTLSGALDWRKLDRSGPKDRGYLTINEVLAVEGARFLYRPGFTLLDTADLEGNARLAFSDGGLAEAAQGHLVNQTFRLTSRHSAVFGNATVNPCGVRLRMDARRGTFGGSFRLQDGDTPRDVIFGGILVNGAGAGFFNLAPLPGAVDPTVLSGAVELLPVAAP